MIQRIADDVFESPAGTHTNADAIVVGNYRLELEPVHGAVLQSLSEHPSQMSRPLPTPVLIRPDMPDDLFDRDDETEQALAAIRAGEAVELHGPHGSGKTALMAHLSRNVDLEEFPDGVVYHRVDGRSAGDILQTTFASFYAGDEPYKPSQAELRHALRSKRAVIMLDDVEIHPRELERLMNYLPRCVFVVASTATPLRGEGRLIPLSGLPLGDAVTLFEKELGERGLLPEEITVAQRLCRALACHPRRVRQAAALVRDEGRSLEELAKAIGRPDDFDAILLESLKQLSVSQRQILGVLATLEGAAVTPDRLASITRVPNSGEVVEALCQRGLVDRVGEKYRISCDLTDAVKEKISPEWTIRLILYFRTLLEKHGNDTQKLLPDLEAIVRVMQWVGGSGLWADALEIARRLEGKLAITGHWDAWGDVLEAALAAARKLEDRREEAWLLHQQGVRALCLGKAHTAKRLLSTALDMRMSQGDTAGTEATRRNLVLVKEAVAEEQDPFEAPSQANEMPVWSKVALAVAALLVLAFLGFAIMNGKPDSPTVQTAVAPLAIETFKPTSPQVIGGESTFALVKLSRAVAGADESSGSAGKTIVDIVSNDPALAKVPRTIVVPPGESEVKVPIETQPVSSTQHVKLTATHAGVGQEIALAIKPALSVELSADNEYGGRIVEFTVRSKAPAPATGLRGELKISRPDVVKGPPTIVILPGMQQTTVELETLPVSTSKDVQVTFDYEDLHPKVDLTVRAGSPFILTPPSIVGGESFSATVVLGYPAPAGGSKFAIKCNNSLLQLPESVTVPQGEIYTRFDIATTPVGKSETVVLSGRKGEIEEQVRLRVRPQFDFRVNADPSTGGPAIGVVTLKVPPPADAILWLRSAVDRSSEGYPVRIRRGQQVARFPIDAAMNEQLVAVYDGVERRATLDSSSREVAATEARPAPTVASATKVNEISLTLEPREVIGGDLAVATIELDSPAPKDGLFIEWTSNNPVVVVPGVTKIPGGEKSTQLVVETGAVNTSTETEVQVSRGDLSAKAPLYVRPGFELTVERPMLVGGESTLAAVHLGVPAPPSGATFELVSRYPEILNVPARVEIAGGEDAVVFEVKTAPVPTPRQVGLMARYEGIERTVSLTLQMDFQITLAVDDNAKVTGTIRLSGPAPEGGAVVQLKSNAPRAVTVPPSIRVPAGENSVMFPIELSGPSQTVTIVGTYGDVKRPVLLTY